MQIVEIIKGLDTQLFLIINGFHSPFFDTFMWALSAKLTWVPLYLSIVYLLIRTFKKDALWIIAALILCVLISDQVASGMLKELVKRLRPSHVESLKPLIHLVKGYDGGLYGFASSHAANTTGLAVLSSLIIRNKLHILSMSVWALLVSYSRIYLGVHYPGDILGGMLIGISAAFFCYWLLNKYQPLSIHTADYNENPSQRMIVPAVLCLSMMAIIAYSVIL